MSYKPSPISFGEAVDVMEQLIMTQHKTWRPDYFEINDKYLLWGYGTTSRSRGSAVAFNNIAVANGTTTTRSVGERLYFNSIHRIQLLSWKRKLKQWYVVSALDIDGNIKQHVFRTRSIEDAKRFTDAIETLILHQKNKQEPKEPIASDSYPLQPLIFS